MVGACGGPSTSPTRTTDASNGTTTARSAPAASSASATALASVAPSPSSIGGLYPVAGHDMWIACKGSGSPTVIFEAGLGSEGYVWWGVSESVSSTTRACTYDRAGVGTSRQRPGNPPTSAGAMAREAWALFDAAGLTGPLILVGHSYGGMIVQLLAAAHPDRVRGAVLVDSSSRHQFEGDWLASEGDWIDNSSPVDRVASARELAGVKSLGAIPLVVLTQGQING